jgi:hypothetical protein
MAGAIQEQVARLEIAVNDSRPVRILKGISNFSDPTQCFTEGGVRLSGKIAALDEVHHQEVATIGEDALDHRGGCPRRRPRSPSRASRKKLR